MKQLLLILLLSCLLATSVFAAPGDTLSDHYNAMWLIAANTGMLSTLLSNMNTMPAAYVTVHSQNEWAVWLKIQIALDFNRIFAPQVYKDILAKVVGYNYEDARFGDEYKAPACTVNGSNIECDEDPTGDARTPLLWRRVSGTFTEQSLTGTLDAGTWTFASVPSGNYYTVSWSDNFQSLPCEYLSIP